MGDISDFLKKLVADTAATPVDLINALGTTPYNAARNFSAVLDSKPIPVPIDKLIQTGSSEDLRARLGVSSDTSLPELAGELLAPTIAGKTLAVSKAASLLGAGILRPIPYYHGTSENFLSHAKGLIPLTDNPEVAANYASGGGGNRAYKSTALFHDTESGTTYQYKPGSEGESLQAVAGKNKGQVLPADLEELQARGIYPTEDWDKVKTGANIRRYAVDTNKTLDLQHKGYDRNAQPLNQSWKEFKDLSDQDNGYAKRIIDDIVRNKSFDWSLTKYPGFQKAWADVIIPQLQKKGYDSIQYWDDMHGTLAVFSDKQLKPVEAVRLQTSDTKRQEEALTNIKKLIDNFQPSK